MSPTLHLKAWRRHRGRMSLATLAKKCGISASMLSRYENGLTSPTIDAASKIAAALEVGLEQLLGVPPEESGKKKRRKAR